MSLHRFSSVPFLSFLLLPVLTAGCTAPADPNARSPREGEPTGQNQAAIQGGEPASSPSLHFAVAVVGQGLCSGTLVAPNLVVTARHCVEEDPESTPPCEGGALVPPSSLRVVVGARAEQGAPSFVVRKILPAPRTDGCVPDLALVQLATVVPSSVAKPARPAVDATFRARPHYVPTVTAIGFGVDDVGEAGVRRIRRNIPVLCVRGDSEFDCGPEANDFMQPFEIVTGPGPCQGDSGGGLYEPKGVEANDPVVLSVVSRGAIEEDGTCLEGVYVRVDAFHEHFVAAAKTAAAEGGYPLPVWAGGAEAPPPPPPAVEVPREDPAPLAPVVSAPPAATTTTTTTSGCSATPAPATRPTLGASLAMLGVALAALSRRRAAAAARR
ncbi:MAG: trypsin-like serine protease [Deltaproteobacteria bacterium]|nr:trypsin-like serine protease [Deltaproteobacteria bacterium]